MTEVHPDDLPADQRAAGGTTDDNQDESREDNHTDDPPSETQVTGLAGQRTELDHDSRGEVLLDVRGTETTSDRVSADDGARNIRNPLSPGTLADDVPVWGYFFQ